MNLKIKHAVSLAVMAAGLASTAPGMADDIFVKAEGLEGESTDARHSNEISALSWSWGVTSATSERPGVRSGAATLQALTFTKYVDRASPKLALDVANGVKIPEANIVVRRPGRDLGFEYLKMKLRECQIVSVKLNGTAGPSNRTTEEVQIAFNKLEYTYYPMKADGTAGGGITVSLDVSKMR